MICFCALVDGIWFLTTSHCSLLLFLMKHRYEHDTTIHQVLKAGICQLIGFYNITLFFSLKNK